MRRWTLLWKLPNLQCRLWLNLLLVFSHVCACDSDRVTGQTSATDCSKHERHTRNFDYMEGGDVRIRRLYSRTQWFLTIDEFGNINGTQDPNNCYSVLEIRTVSEGGVLAIKGLKSQYYISMNRMGTLQGKKEYNDSCDFKEVFLENFYTAYASVKWTKNGKEMFISLSQKGRPLKGKKTRKESVASHFIPRKCREDEKTLA
ncbi:fibroblast growth factor 7 [Triplophysa dalaica]|uniref:fibroblast growth factor 7-like n=1 Tax=Triplophysa dalaica TaxID=1582913 RepID=UPI0024E03019|nr:fibroblast growth factor 7-like [Triplophysa dalaica]XP_056622923.1 fibroblast growth factor 7 [Triplophysa dalaica]